MPKVGNLSIAGPVSVTNASLEDLNAATCLEACCTVFQRLRYVQTSALRKKPSMSSEEAFHVFGRNLPIFVTNLLVFRKRIFRFAVKLRHKTNVGKAFGISASILKTSTIPLNITIDPTTLQCTHTSSVTPAAPTSEGN